MADPELMPYLRQLRHNDGSDGFVFAYEAEGADRAFALLRSQIDALLAHCPDGECGECAAIICPHKCAMHYHHDGCPACAEHDAAE